MAAFKVWDNATGVLKYAIGKRTTSHNRDALYDMVVKVVKAKDEDWETIMALCDEVNKIESEKEVETVLDSLKMHLKSVYKRPAERAFTILEAMMKNCDYRVLKLVSTDRWRKRLAKLCCNTRHKQLEKRMLQFFGNWREHFRLDPDLAYYWNMTVMEVASTMGMAIPAPQQEVVREVQAREAHMRANGIPIPNPDVKPRRGPPRSQNNGSESDRPSTSDGSDGSTTFRYAGWRAHRNGSGASRPVANPNMMTCTHDGREPQRALQGGDGVPASARPRTAAPRMNQQPEQHYQPQTGTELYTYGAAVPAGVEPIGVGGDNRVTSQGSVVYGEPIEGAYYEQYVPTPRGAAPVPGLETAAVAAGQARPIGAQTARPSRSAHELANNPDLVRDISEEDLNEVFAFARHNRAEQIGAAFVDGVPVDIRDRSGNTPFIVCAQNNNKKAAKMCLRFGADIDAQNHKGNTALHFLFAFNYSDLAQYIISKGANDYIPNFQGQTCYQGIGDLATEVPMGVEYEPTPATPERCDGVRPTLHVADIHNSFDELSVSGGAYVKYQ